MRASKVLALVSLTRDCRNPDMWQFNLAKDNGDAYSDSGYDAVRCHFTPAASDYDLRQLPPETGPRPLWTYGLVNGVGSLSNLWNIADTTVRGLFDAPWALVVAYDAKPCNVTGRVDRSDANFSVGARFARFRVLCHRHSLHELVADVRMHLDVKHIGQCVRGYDNPKRLTLGHLADVATVRPGTRVIAGDGLKLVSGNGMRVTCGHWSSITVRDKCSISAGYRAEIHAGEDVIVQANKHSKIYAGNRATVMPADATTGMTCDVGAKSFVDISRKAFALVVDPRTSSVSGGADSVLIANAGTLFRGDRGTQFHVRMESDDVHTFATVGKRGIEPGVWYKGEADGFKPATVEQLTIANLA